MQKQFKEQFVPIFLTITTFFALWALLHLGIVLLNLLPSSNEILFTIRKRDVLVGLTIYLKTSVDFGIFIGNLMKANSGWKNRIAIEIGTAVGNALGTLVVLTIWNFFREVPLLMALMIFLASLVLLRMAQDSFVELEEKKLPQQVHTIILFAVRLLSPINSVFRPLLQKLVPHANLTKMKALPWMSLAIFSFSIPFILGLDDFAGYIPLFSVINVYGFAIGVFLGHMILNVALFVSPKKTVQLVSTPLVLIIGGVAFVAIAGWGFYEVAHLLLSLLGSGH